jgi:type II secretory pathway pseudopilin PulG
MRERRGFTLVELLVVIAMPSRSISPSTGRSASGPAAQAASRREQAGGTTLLP